MMKDEPEITLPHTRPLDSKTQSLMPKKSTPKKIVGTAGQTLPEEKDEGGRMKDEENEPYTLGPLELQVVGAVQLEIPLGTLDPAAYVSTHVDGHLDRVQAGALRRLQNGLDAQNVRLQNGRRVATTIDAVRWLLERIAKMAGRRNESPN